MKRDATGKFTSNWELEAKKRVSVTLTSTAWRLLEAEAQKYGISRSELIEQTARGFATASRQRSATQQRKQDPEGVHESSSSRQEEPGPRLDSSRALSLLPPQALIQEQQQAIATLQRQKQELEALLNQEQQRTQQIASQETERRVAAILQSMTDAFVVFDRNWCYTYINPAAAKILGRPPAELLGKQVWNEVFPELAGGVADRQLHRAVAEQVPVSWEEFGQPLQRWIEARAYPSSEGVAVYFRDITERKQAEQALQDTAERLSLALAAAKLGDWSWDATTDLVTFSERAAEIFGIPPGPHLTWTAIRELLHTDDRERARMEVEQAIATHSDYSIEYRVLHPNGSACWVAAKGRAHYAPTGEVLGMLGVVQDITERKQLEAELQHQKQQFKMLAENAPDIIARFDAKFRHLYVSPSVERTTGLPATAFLGKTNAELGLPEGLCRCWAEGLAQVFATGQEQQIEFQFPTPAGKRWYQSRLVPEFAGDGTIESVLSIARDFEDYKQAEQALRESELKFRTLADTMPQLFWIARPDGYHEYFNQRWFEYTGMTLEQTQGWGWNHLLHPDDRQRSLEVWQESLRTGHNYAIEYRFRRASDGAYRWFLGRAFPLRDQDGQIIKWFGSCTDIHDQRCLLEERDRVLAQEQAARQQAEAANRVKDEFLAVLSHELRTPLNPILGWSRLLRQGKLAATQTIAALETIERNAKLQTQLIDDLLDISRILQGKLGLNSAPVDLKATLTAAIETVRLAAEAKALQIQTDFAPQVGPVLGDATRLQQVIWNLLSNAVKFTPETGQIQVRLSTALSQAQIQVKDTGKGIHPDFLPYVFDTFRQADSTTTRSFGGLGLGLAIVRHLVELHGGMVKAESAGEGKGASFTVTLPLLPTSVSTAQETVAMTNSYNLQGVHVLAVDDDVDNLELLQFILEQAAATVIVAASATEALEQLHQATPHLIVADIAMPQVDGYTLMQRIRELPAEQGGQIPAIALTAYAGERNQQQALAAGFQLHLTKPVDPEALVQAILKLLDQAKPHPLS